MGNMPKLPKKHLTTIKKVACGCWGGEAKEPESVVLPPSLGK